MHPSRNRHARTALALAALLGAAAAQAAPTCYGSYGSIDANKPNKLFLYFPGTDDPTFPAYGGQPTSPAKKFDISLLPNAPPSGTTAQLRDRIYDVVATAYCEFNVQVLPPTTSNPDALVSPPARRNMIAIGSDANGDASGVYFGQAQAVDTGDAVVVDHGRVWGGSYGVYCGAPGRELSGAGNTLERWALGLGGTAAHEAGHNYGLAHSTALHAGEDSILNHLMPAGGNTPCADRVGHLRHFSDTDYGILANNVGLTLQSLWNFDFVNPNAATAAALQMEVLSLSPTLSAVSTWLANSPWDVPGVTAAGTKVFKGTVYRRYLVTWQTPKAWNSPNIPASIAGRIRGGEKFHVGTHLAGADIETATTQVILSDATLLDINGNPLPLHPRVPTFDTGTLAPDGSYTFNLANLAAANLILKNLQAYVLPRPLHIDSLMLSASGALKLFDVTGEPVVPWRQVQLGAATGSIQLPAGSNDRPGEAALLVGNLVREGHNVRIKTNADSNDAFGRTEVNRATPGMVLTDPFPGASVMLTGDLIEPGATQWDPTQQRYVSADLVTKLFIQVAGQRAKPVEGSLSGIAQGKVVCSNLNTRNSVTITLGTSTSFDCERSGLVSLHGDRVQITQIGRVSSSLPAVQLGGLDIGKVVCTNLNTRRSVTFVPASSLAAVDCVAKGLAVAGEHVLEVTQIGTVR